VCAREEVEVVLLLLLPLRDTAIDWCVRGLVLQRAGGCRSFGRFFRALPVECAWKEADVSGKASLVG
jgi:hypothetical protein